MGSPMAPSYANLFMGQLEHNMLMDAPGGLIPLEWIRFIDDIFALWTHGIDKHKEFLHYINNFHPTIKFEFEYSLSIFLILVFTLTTLTNWNQTFLLNEQIKLYFYIMGPFTPTIAKLASYIVKPLDTFD